MTNGASLAPDSAPQNANHAAVHPAAAVMVGQNVTNSATLSGLRH
jgi:hypothetical protein